ncbi:hypothetical protein D3C84_416060 [compost metagenome]
MNVQCAESVAQRFMGCVAVAFCMLDFLHAKVLSGQQVSDCLTRLIRRGEAWEVNVY